MNLDTRKPPQDAVTVRHLRLGIGSVGLALPVVLVVGHIATTRRLTLLDSLSAYYHSEMRDVFVGAMCAVGVFLISYRYRRPDDLLGTVAGVLAVAVALFPTATGVRSAPLGESDRIAGVVHQVAAAGLFALLAVFCLFLFVRPDTAGVPPRRSAVVFYRTCGGLILLAVALALASTRLPDPTRHTVKPVLWCEILAVFAFGAAWVAKSDALLRAAEPVDGLAVTGPDARPRTPA
ncbi:hypothetical protein [Micromonospora sp. WMMD975]|uniref:hypothetical protein n=1 Tax=Micromonospora sp. WMMD975 TaxID=3016087 RepID=UPI00249BBD36|nr:hypothetical protein [Micromonospora sp. WMMD975]WFE31938.1 hypothetical protein O7613_20380 [Micromonospora sp. WMMD975]